jgi:hypothetical protein
MDTMMNRHAVFGCLVVGLLGLTASACGSAEAGDPEALGTSRAAVLASAEGAIVNVSTNKCLDVYEAGTANGTKIDSYQCDATPNQQWYAGNGDGTLRPYSSTRYDIPAALDAPLGQPAGTQLQIWAPTGAANQMWFPTGQVMGPGGKCLDVTGGDVTNGTPVQLWACNGNPQQQWFWDTTNFTIQPLGYTAPDGNPYCLDLTGGDTQNGTVVQVWECNGKPQQVWYPDWTWGWQNSLGPCLDDSGDSTTNGNKIQGYTCNQTDAQSWWVQGGIFGSNGSASGCVDLTGDSSDNGAKVQFWESCSDDTSQVWAYFPWTQ